MLNFFLLVFINSALSIFAKSSPSINTLPALGSIKRLINLTKVDFPLPDNPIITNISPEKTLNDTWFTPTVIPVSFKISAFVFPPSNSFIPSFGFLPNTLVNFLTSIFNILFTSITLYFT